jgi:hypothetical protein
MADAPSTRHPLPESLGAGGDFRVLVCRQAGKGNRDVSLVHERAILRSNRQALGGLDAFQLRGFPGRDTSDPVAGIISEVSVLKSKIMKFAKIKLFFMIFSIFISIFIE